MNIENHSVRICKECIYAYDVQRLANTVSQGFTVGVVKLVVKGVVSEIRWGVVGGVVEEDVWHFRLLWAESRNTAFVQHCTLIRN